MVRLFAFRVTAGVISVLRSAMMPLIVFVMVSGFSHLSCRQHRWIITRVFYNFVFNWFYFIRFGTKNQGGNRSYHGFVGEKSGLIVFFGGREKPRNRSAPGRTIRFCYSRKEGRLLFSFLQPGGIRRRSIFYIFSRCRRGRGRCAPLFPPCV